MNYLIDMGWAPTMRTIGKGRHEPYLRGLEARIKSSLPDAYRVRAHIVTIKQDHLARVVIGRPDGSSDLIEFSVDRLAGGKTFCDLGARLNAGRMASVGAGGGHVALHHSDSGHGLPFDGSVKSPVSWLELVDGCLNKGALCVGAQGGQRVRWAVVLSEHGPKSISVYLSANNRPDVKWFLSSGALLKSSAKTADMSVLFPDDGRPLRYGDAALVCDGEYHGLVVRDPHGGLDLDSEDSLEVALESGGHVVDALDPSFARCVGPQGINRSTVYRTSSSRIVKVSDLLSLPWAGAAPPPFHGWPTPSSQGV